MAANSDISASIIRRGPGKPFPRGTSGNPSGRPKVVFEIRELARQFGPAAIAKLAEMAGLAAGTPAEAEATRVAAIKELLDRGFGKATQPLSGESSAGPVCYEFIWGNATPAPEPEPEAAANGTPVVLNIRWADAVPATPASQVIEHDEQTHG